MSREKMSGDMVPGEKVSGDKVPGDNISGGKFPGDKVPGDKGSVTITYALLLPLLLLVVLTGWQCLLMAMAQTMLQTTLAECVTEAAALWMRTSPEAFSSEVDASGEGTRLSGELELYAQLKTVMGMDKSKQKAFASWLERELPSRSHLLEDLLDAMPADRMDIGVWTGGGIPYGMLCVSVDIPITSPLLRMWTPGGHPSLHAQSEALMTVPAAVLQDLDWGIQMFGDTKTATALEDVAKILYRMGAANEEGR